MEEKSPDTKQLNLTLGKVLDNDLKHPKLDDYFELETFGLQLMGLELEMLLKELKNKREEEPMISVVLSDVASIGNKYLDIANYDLKDMKSDYTNLMNGFVNIEGVSESNKDKIKKTIDNVSQITKTKWEVFQKRFAEISRVGRIANKGLEKRYEKQQTLTIEQRQFLNSDTNFEISTLIEGAEMIPRNKEYQMESFKSLLVEKVFDRVAIWQKKNRALIEKAYAKQELKKSKVAVENIFIAGEGNDKESLLKLAGTGGVGKLADGVMGLAGDLMGNMTGWGFTFIEQDPILSKFFHDAESKKILYKSLKPGGEIKDQAGLEKIVGDRINGLFGANKNGEKLTLDDLKKSYFNMGAKEDIAKSAQAGEIKGIALARFLKKKHETVTPSYRKREGQKEESWQERYDTYLRMTGLAALNFPEWMEQNMRDGKIPRLEYLWNKIKDMFSGILKKLEIDWFDDDQTDAQKNELADFYGQAAGDIPKNPTEGEVEKEAKEKKSLSEISLYPVFREKFKGQEEVYVYIDGKPVNLMDPKSNVSVLEGFGFQHINSLLEKYPHAKKIFSDKEVKALDIENIDLMARNNGSDMGTGLNVRFDETNSIEFSYDSTWKRAGGGGLVVAGVGLAGVLTAFTPVLMATAGAGGVGVGSSYFKTMRGAEKFFESGNLDIKYSDLSRDKLSGTINFLKRATEWKSEPIKVVDLLDDKDKKFFDPALTIDDISADMFTFNKKTKKIEMCKSLKNLTQYMTNIKYTEKITQPQLLGLDKYLSENFNDYDGVSFEKVKDIKWSTWLYSDVNMLDGTTKDPDDVKNFIQVNNGGKGVRDDNFENFKAFLSFVEKEYSPES